MKFKTRAFLIHLIFSLLIAFISVFVVFFVWHAAPLAKAVGGVTSIFFMMLAIDSILGPLLTFVVAKEGKKSLKFDLSVIVIVQIVALTYGIYNISLNRPVYIAFDSHRFEVVQANSIPKEELSKTKSEYATIPYGSPKYVAVIRAKDDDEKTNRLFVEVESQVAPSMMPSLYEPLDNQWNHISKKSKPLSDLTEHNTQTDVDKILTKYPQAQSWLPLKAYEVSMVVLIDDKEVIDIVDLRGW